MLKRDVRYYLWCSLPAFPIVCKVDDFGLKLSYFIQYCIGEAKEAISDCVIMELESGYIKAKDILAPRYSRPHITARSLIQQLVSGPKIKPNDGAGLSKLAIQMTRCSMTLEEMGYLSDLNNYDNLLKIVRRLQISIRAKWVERADMIIEMGNDPNFGNLASFIDTRTHFASTMYGQEILESQSGAHTLTQKTTTPKKATTLNTQGTTSTPQPPSKSSAPVAMKNCKLCQQDHNLVNCGVCLVAAVGFTQNPLLILLTKNTKLKFET